MILKVRGGLRRFKTVGEGQRRSEKVGESQRKLERECGDSTNGSRKRETVGESLNDSLMC